MDNASMQEKTHAFSMNKQAIKNSSLSIKDKLLIMGKYHIASTHVTIMLNEFFWIAKEKGRLASNMMIVSYHNLTGYFVIYYYGNVGLYHNLTGYFIIYCYDNVSRSRMDHRRIVDRPESLVLKLRLTLTSLPVLQAHGSSM